jgi:hypothetical protein
MNKDTLIAILRETQSALTNELIGKFICPLILRKQFVSCNIDKECRYLIDTIQDRLQGHHTAEQWIYAQTNDNEVYHQPEAMRQWRILWIDSMIEEINLTGELK